MRCWAAPRLSDDRLPVARSYRATRRLVMAKTAVSVAAAAWWASGSGRAAVVCQACGEASRVTGKLAAVSGPARSTRMAAAVMAVGG
ncbi:MAG: hypothetical protein ACYC6Y_22350, partial [Thermoguttaceae bacterium]